jgi:hypothetical protein
LKQLCWITLLLALLIAGCRQQTTNATDITIVLSIEPEPPVVGAAELHITLISADNLPITDAKVTVRGDMNHAGMVPVIAEVERIEGNQYVVPFEWTMAGDWIIEVSAELPDGTTAAQTFDQSVAVSE